MREDMAKLLVERPRYGRGMKFQRNAMRMWQRVAEEERPGFESIKARWDQSKVARKGLNENLAPLRRFLRSRLGRPWEDVYGEICERINRDSAVQLHIWQHLMWEVVTDPVKLERIRTERRYARWRDQFYVDPATRLLCELKPRLTKRILRAQRRRRRYVMVVEGRCYRRIGGIWYEVELAPLPEGERPVWDAILRKSTEFLTRGDLQHAYGKCVYAARKRQLNKREIVRLMDALRRLRRKGEHPRAD
jgi:hypothetical protein